MVASAPIRYRRLEKEGPKRFTLIPATDYYIGAIGGTCGGRLDGMTYTTNTITADCTVIVSFTDTSYMVTPSVDGEGGIISPDTEQIVGEGGTSAFTVTPDTGYSIASVDGSCGGTLVGDIYTTGPITADCTVEASFVINSFAVSPSAGTGGTIDPDVEQNVDYNGNISFTVTPDTGYSIASVDGSCGGTLVGDIYTTGPITADCTVEASFAINSFVVSPSAGTGGTIDPAVEQNVDYNGNTSFTVAPDTGYSIASVDGSCGGTLVGDIYTTGPITADCTVEASFAINSFVVSPSAGTGGTIDPAVEQNVDYNGNTSFTVAPDTGYSIASVDGSCGGTLVGDIYTTGPITADCTVEASFAINSFVVSPSAGNGGTIDPSAEQNVDYNGNISFTVAPDTGYSIASVDGSCGGTLVGDIYTTGPITADCTVEASFAINSFVVSPSAGTGGTIDPAVEQNVDYNGNTSFTVAPDTGYSIASVDGSCGGTLVGDIYTTGPITADCTVEASFAINSFVVSPSAGTGGTIDPAVEQNVDYNGNTSFTVAPDTGYSIASVDGSCGGTLVGDIYTTGPITADCTVEASFAINSFVVSPSAGTGGTIDPAVEQNVDYNGNTSFTVAPDTGYSIASVDGSCGGTLVGDIYTTGPITADCTVEASFAINSFVVSPSAGTGGTIDPAVEQNVDYNGNTSFTVAPDTGYSIASVAGSCGGTLVGDIYTTGPITADCTVEASFAINSFVVSPSAGTGGTIDPAVEQNVDYNGNTSFTVAPDTGYSIASVDGSCGGTLVGDIYTTGPITADCTVEASFAINSFVVSPSAGTGGTIDPAVEQNVDYNGNISFTVAPDTGYSIASVAGSCGGTLVGDIYTTGPITADCTVEASFVINSFCGKPIWRAPPPRALCLPPGAPLMSTTCSPLW